MTASHPKPTPDDPVCWLKEHPAPGLERCWPKQTKELTRPEHARRAIIEAAEAVRWQRRSQPLPVEPAMALLAMLAAAAGPEPLAVAYGDRFPVPTSSSSREGFIVASRQLVSATSFSPYFLVLDGWVQIIMLDVRDHTVPPGRVTEMCVAEFHALRRGWALGPGGGRMACQCTCGHRTEP